MAAESEALRPLSNSVVQWHEARGFDRVYGRNPEAQARFVKTLLGFKDIFDWRSLPEIQDTSQAIGHVISAFAKLYPDFLEPRAAADMDPDLSTDIDYQPEGLMLSLLESLNVTPRKEQNG